MKVFFLDLWQDLRAKRLWPVAVALVLALVAVPILLAKPAEDPGPPPAASATPPAAKDEEENAELAQVTLYEGEDSASGSTLGVFDPSNPFKPPAKVVKAGEQNAGTQSGPSEQTASESGADSGGSAEGGGGGSSSGGGSPTPPAGGSEPTPPDSGGGTTTKVYKYVVDVTFTANGRTRKIKGLEKLEMLPNEASPLLIAMGVTVDGGNAVFLVDSTLKAAGEGKCKPSGKECAFAYIGPGSEHVFTEEDGDSYTVRVDEIRKVEVKPGAQTAHSDRVRANASVGSPRRFVPPFIADLVVVASDELEDSNRDDDRR
jgi:hypothetical protein